MQNNSIIYDKSSFAIYRNLFYICALSLILQAATAQNLIYTLKQNITTSDNLTDVVLSPSGTYLLKVGTNTLQFYNLVSNTFTLMAISPSKNDSKVIYKFNTNGSILLQALSSLVINVYFLNSSQYSVFQVLVGHKSYITCLQISTDSQTIFSASNDGTIIIWSYSNSVFVKLYNVTTNLYLRSITYNNINTKLSVTGYSNTSLVSYLFVYNLTNSTYSLAQNNSLGDVGILIKCVQSLNMLALMGRGSVYIYNWNSTTYAIAQYIQLPYTSPLKFDSNNNSIVVGFKDSSFALYSYNSTNKNYVAIQKFNYYPTSLLTIRISSDSALILIADFFSAIGIYQQSCSNIYTWNGSQCNVNCNLDPNSASTNGSICNCKNGFVWSSLYMGCTANCLVVANSYLLNYNQTSCKCNTTFVWDSTYLMCKIDCSILLYSNGFSGDPYQCSCYNQFYFNSSTNQCLIKCSADANSAGTLNQSTCICKTNFTWNNYLFFCNFNCSVDPYSIGVTYMANQCNCINNFIWNSSLYACVFDCSSIPYSSGIKSTTSNTCQCQSNYQWNTNYNECTFKTVYIIIIAVIISMLLLIIGLVWYRYKFRPIERIIVEDINYSFQNQTTKGDIKVETCSICLEECQTIKTSCNHYFHFKCIAQWFSRNQKCPNCNTKPSQLKILCQNCEQYKQTIQFCNRTCRAINHKDCYEKLYKNNTNCKNCSK